LVVDYARLSRVLPHAAAVVHAGGIGTCAEALRAGIPSVVIPFSFDQPDNAYRMRRLGVAEILSRRAITVTNLADKLRQVLGDPSYLEKATALSAHIDPALAVRRAVKRMEQACANHRKVSGA
jgi:UDP:flavonoid glycosyltransferase YjiC (YdhE family)